MQHKLSCSSRCYRFFSLSVLPLDIQTILVLVCYQIGNNSFQSVKGISNLVLICPTKNILFLLSFQSCTNAVTDCFGSVLGTSRCKALGDRHSTNSLSLYLQMHDPAELSPVPILSNDGQPYSRPGFSSTFYMEII